MVVALCSCTPLQRMWYDAEVAKGNQAAADAIVRGYADWKASVTAGYPCPEWFDEAMSAGFTAEQWQEPISRIMYRESHCNPGAKNPHSTAAGLMQELRMWADDCGGVYADLFDPTFNLNCAYHIYQVQGWRAWATY